ncbi:ABC transporter permease [Actinoplanes sp. NPDC023714]|uniref:ABC transporter permease n=1 Tax=Actinoplanes sp. NPDC023714 TaxID=3154322 RepID=UPI00340A4203
MNLIRAELLKVRTTPLWRNFGLLLFLLWSVTLAFNWVNSAVLPPEEALGVTVDLATTGQFFGILIVLLLGAVMVTGEFLHLTITTTFLITPRRERVVLAKFAAAVLIALVVWAALTVLNLIAIPLVTADLGMSGRLGAAEVWQAIGLNGVAFALWAVLGVGCGVLFRGQMAATLTLAILYVLGPPVATGLFFLIDGRVDGFAELDFLVPTVASDLMITGSELPTGPGRLTGAAVLVAYTLVTGVVGALLMRRRDIA